MFKKNTLTRLIGKPLPRISKEELSDAVLERITKPKLTAVEEFEQRIAKNNIVIKGETFEFHRRPMLKCKNVKLIECTFYVDTDDDRWCDVDPETTEVLTTNCHIEVRRFKAVDSINMNYEVL